MNEVKNQEQSQARPLARTLARELTVDEVGLVSGAFQKTGPDPWDDGSEWPGGGSDAELK